MTPDDVRPYAEAHGRAVVAGDTAHVLADIDPAIHADMGPVLKAMPRPVTAADVVTLEADGDGVVAQIRYDGADTSATVRSVWKQVGDRPLIVEAAPV